MFQLFLLSIYTNCADPQGSLLEGESRLHHAFIVGYGWEGQACHAWRLGVSFAGQGVGQSWGQGAISAAVAKQQGGQGFVGGGEAVIGAGAGPLLERQGSLKLGPDTVEAGRIAVEELGQRMVELEALVFKQDTYVTLGLLHTFFPSF